MEDEIQPAKPVRLPRGAARKKAAGPKRIKLKLQPAPELPTIGSDLLLARDILRKKLIECHRLDSPKVRGPAAKLGIENITGVSIGEKITGGVATGLPCVVVHVRKKSVKSDVLKSAIVVSPVPGVLVDVVSAGPIVAHLPSGPVVGYFRPVAGGCSLSSRVVPKGTATCVVSLSAPGLPRGRELALLGNNHTLAGCNTVAINDWILQPSPADGGGFPLHAIARLRDAINLDFDPNGWNEVDCAVAAARTQDCVSGVIQLGPILKTPLNPVRGRQVAKYGAATGLTYGIIEDEDLADHVEYRWPVPQRARFRKLFKIASLGLGPFSVGGDSGSLIVDVATRRPVGLIVGGDLAFSYGCRISTVLTLLNARIF